MSAAKVELGRLLFYDADLSVDGTLSCASCHEQRRGFADGNMTRPGVHETPGKRNVPGLANVAWLPRLTYADPSATTLEKQAMIPLTGENPLEMGMKDMEAELTRRLNANKCYRQMFRKAFPERKGQIDFTSVTASLGAFQRMMISYDSPYDRHLTGENSALSPLAKQGMVTFKNAGCAACHKGPNFTDANYHRLEPAKSADPGLIEQTGRADDAGRFRTPILRNVALTGPYWHDGTSPTMEDAIRRHPGTQITDNDMPALTAFLRSLTGTNLMKNPQLSRPDSACGKPL
ncbi:MAG: c-type cytochrome [Sphingobium sp.]|nr:c-type cytochrome [Sphingobium sp.]